MSPDAQAAAFRKRNLSTSSVGSNKRSHSDNPSLDSPAADSAEDDEGSIGASNLQLNSPKANSPRPASNLAREYEHEPMAHDSEQPGSVVHQPEVTPPTGAAPPGDVQRDILADELGCALEAGDSWFLIARSWYRKWETACAGEPTSKDDVVVAIDEVGPIDTFSLLDPATGLLRMPIVDGVDCSIVPAQAWGMLKSWYGVSGPELERAVVASAGPGSERVEFYPPQFHFVKLLPSAAASPAPASTPVSAPTESLSSGASVADLQKAAAEALNLTRPVRLWRLASGDASVGPAAIGSDELPAAEVELVTAQGEQTLEDALLADNMSRLVVEEQNEDGTWVVDAATIANSLPDSGSTAATTAAASAAPAAAAKKGGLFANGPFSHSNPNTLIPRNKSKGHQPSSDKDKEKKEHAHRGLLHAIGGAITRSKSPRREQPKGQRGLTGLTNLGNTCFMNSALQCMSNTKELQEYFLSGVYHDEINRDNPLGMGGAVAEAFGQLVERLWASSGSATAPREFKQSLARFAPQFSGYGQQDSQELLAFLLDGVHEDLNRILKKPATNAPDWEGGGEGEMLALAKTCWEQYRSRNDSVIVDLFQGQYRSTVVCPDCDKVSITFDPFMYVTTNLPVTKKWSGTVYYIPLDPEQPRMQVELELAKSATIKSAKSALAAWFGSDPKRIVCGEEWHSKFFKSWYDDDSILDVDTGKDRLLFFETLGPLNQPKPRFYGKKNTQPQHPPDRAISVVVMHRLPSKREVSRFGNHAETFGSPFVLSLTPEQAATPEGITRALAVQYARVSTRGAELIESVEAFFDASSQPAPAAVALPATPPAEVDAPMEVDGQPAEAEAGAVPSTSALPPSEPAAAEASTKRKPLFSLEVSKSNNKGTLPFNQSDTNGETVALQSRVKTTAAAAAGDSSSDDDSDDPFAGGNPNRPSLPGSFIQSQPMEADEEHIEHAGNAPAERVVSGPLVKTGDFLYAQWDSAALERFFGGDGTGAQSLWGQVNNFVDPALEASRARQRGAKRTITLADCLTEFTKEERLGEDDQWYCSACKEHKQASKKVELWKVPDVLIFALKRFSTGRYSRDKIDDLVDFPHELDMQPFVEGDKVEAKLARERGSPDQPESLLYDLYAVDNHYGGLGGGHYTAYAKNPENGKWYDFDDSRVTEVRDPASVVTKAGYLLFYRRRTSRPIGGDKNQELVNSAILSRSATLPPKPEEGQAHSDLGGSDDDGDEDLYRSAPAVESRFPPPSADTADSFGLIRHIRSLPSEDDSDAAEGPHSRSASDIGEGWDMAGSGESAGEGATGVDVEDDVVDIKVDDVDGSL